SMDGSASADFAINGGQFPLTIQPGASTTLSLTFTPAATGPRNASLTLNHNAGSGSTVVSVSGVGIVSGPAINISPSALDFGQQQVHTSSSASLLTIENPG